VPKMKSAKKSLRKSYEQRDRNKHITSTMRSAIKQVREAADATGGQEALARAISVIDVSQKKGVIHKNTASRYKSRLTHFVRGLG
jgi:small subunit ribosomal protein S20